MNKTLEFLCCLPRMPIMASATSLLEDLGDLGFGPPDYAAVVSNLARDGIAVVIRQYDGETYYGVTQDTWQDAKRIGGEYWRTR